MFIIGEGEKVINELIDVYLSNPDKGLEKFLKVDGVYIPEFDNETKIAIIEDLNETYHVTYPIVSEGDVADDMSVFNNSIMLNVSRGCTRGCRFCMANYLYRPTRETDYKRLIDIASPSKETIDALQHLDLPSGVEISIRQ